ncbi:MAG TPA: hypothetical protein VGJ94_00700 [Syntrophorhabdaceae bacterium]|jgi:hypothetical protein
MAIRKKGATALATLALFSITLLFVSGFAGAEAVPEESAAGEQESTAAGPEPVDEPQEIIKGIPFNPRRLRTGVSVTATLEINPVLHKGPCPASFTLKGYISANNPTKVAYKFVRKDAPPSNPEILTFEKAGTKEVSHTFSVGAEGGTSPFEGWVHLEAVFPVNNKVRSDSVFFSGRCTTPGAEGAAVTNEIQEDCELFDAAAVRAYQEKNIWKIGDGKKVLFGFGVDKREAENSLAVMSRYRITKSCFIGRPKPSFHYMLSGDSAPAGEFKGEACKAFAPAAITVRQIKTGWVLSEGERTLIAFGERKSEADRALSIIKKYGFTHFCLMATGKVDFMYMRK